MRPGSGRAPLPPLWRRWVQEGRARAVCLDHSARGIMGLARGDDCVCGMGAYSERVAGKISKAITLKAVGKLGDGAACVYIQEVVCAAPPSGAPTA